MLKKLLVLLSLAIMLALFTIKGMTFLDPDFGWHLKMGELIAASGLPRTDPFSYTMKSFPFVDHEWLTNLLIYKLNGYFGFTGLAIIYGLLAAMALLIATEIVGWKPGSKIQFLLRGAALFLAIAAIFPFVGVRPQMISWFFLAVLLWVVREPSRWHRWRLFLPFFILLWTNLHGSFPLALVVIALTVGVRDWREKNFNLVDLLVGIACVLVTFINPYGPRLWGEVWQQLSDSSLRWKIAEWNPAIFNIHLTFIVLVALALSLFWRYRKKIFLEDWLFPGFLLFQASLGQRHIPLWVMASLPLVFSCLGRLEEEIMPIKYGQERLQKLSYLFLVMSLILGLSWMGYAFWSMTGYREGKFYPNQAITFLKHNLPEAELFSDYGWGGYLIWKLPEKKVFIDGRMPSWRYQANLAGESNYAMKDYEKIILGKEGWQEMLDRFQIKTVLWPVPSKKKKLPEEPFDLTEELPKKGWQEIYRDQTAVIFSRRQLP